MWSYILKQFEYLSIHSLFADFWRQGKREKKFFFCFHNVLIDKAAIVPHVIMNEISSLLYLILFRNIGLAC